MFLYAFLKLDDCKNRLFSGTISSINHPVFPHVREMELVRRGEEDLSPYILH